MKGCSLMAALLLAYSALNAHDNYNVRSPSVPEADHEHGVPKKINTKELNQLRQSTALVIIDARSEEYDDGKRIPGAKLVPHDAEEAVIIEKLPNKTAAIVVYCVNVDCPASDMLARRLMRLGYTNVSEYPEGIEGWEKSGNPVETVKKANAPR